MMGDIEWIEHVLENSDSYSFSSRCEVATATRVAREDLKIKTPEKQIRAFVRDLPSLFEWFSRNYRDFPWRRNLDPWSIIVAEILLQRTHASAVDGVYSEFMDRFPEPEAVARAERNELFEMVESLGFGNKRTRTLTSLSHSLIEDHDGRVPPDLETLQELPRIGPYTARACLCFAFGKPLALVDTNVATVVSDVFGYESPTRAHKDEAMYEFLDAVIPQDPEMAKIFNLAILDIRAAVCSGQSGNASCPLGRSCRRG